MEEKVFKKVERFVELSLLFSKSAEDIFGREELKNYATGFIGSFEVNENKEKEPTRAEKIRAKAEIKAKLAEDFDEYKQLQKDLEEYFKTINKFN